MLSASLRLIMHKPVCVLCMCVHVICVRVSLCLCPSVYVQ